MDRNEFMNKAYKVLIPVLEDIEHNQIPIKNGHHLSQQLSNLLWNAFKDTRV